MATEFGFESLAAVEPTAGVASVREHPWAAILPRVAKPARYLGGEEQQIVKAPESVTCRFVLAFPALSHSVRAPLHACSHRAPHFYAPSPFWDYYCPSRCLSPQTCPDFETFTILHGSSRIPGLIPRLYQRSHRGM